MSAPWILAAAVLACTVSSAEAMQFEAEAALVSDYRWRGVSLSEEEPSLQLEASAAFDAGPWIWGGLNTLSDVYGGVELGLGAGYDVELAGFTWSAGAIAYIYPDADALDYGQIDVSVTRAIGPFTLSGGVEYVPEQEHYDDDDTYVWAGAAWDIGRFTLHAQAGRDEGAMTAQGRATDYALGASAAFGAFAAGLTFVESDDADSAWVLRLSRSFSGAPR